MLLKQGDKVHVITRRLFEADLRRHFVGEVQEATEAAARVEGFAFVFDSGTQQFTRRPDRRVRIVSLSDGGLIINILPRAVRLEDLEYRMSRENHLVVTDGKTVALDINEFTATR